MERKLAAILATERLIGGFLSSGNAPEVRHYSAFYRREK